LNFSIAISSHINNTKQRDAVIGSLCGGIPVHVFIGGCENRKQKYENDIVHHYCNHNSFDHTSLIEILELNLYSDYWFVVHDTVTFGEKSIACIENFGPGDHISISKAGWWNMGLFSNNFIQRNKEYILSLKNCKKSQAILSEKFYKRLSHNDEHYCEENQITDQEYKDIYAEGYLRKPIYFSSLDITKYQKYYPESSFLKDLIQENKCI
jgi:hypothetical protein